MAGLYTDHGKHKQAEKLYRRALQILQNTFGQEHPDVARMLGNLAVSAFMRKRYADSEQHSQQAIAILEKTLGPEHPEVATALDRYSQVLRHLKRNGEAEAIEIRIKALVAKP